MAFKATPNKSYKPANVDDLMAWQYTSSGVFPAKVSTGNGGKFDLNILYHDFPAAQKEETAKRLNTPGNSLNCRHAATMRFRRYYSVKRRKRGN